MSPEQEVAYAEAMAAWNTPEPDHRIGGYPAAIQNEPSEDIVVTLKATGRRERAEDWKLLLQVDAEERCGMQWGDCGLLYFMMRDEDLRAGRFEECWMILQYF